MGRGKLWSVHNTVSLPLVQCSSLGSLPWHAGAAPLWHQLSKSSSSTGCRSFRAQAPAAGWLSVPMLAFLGCREQPTWAWPSPWAAGESAPALGACLPPPHLQGCFFCTFSSLLSLVAVGQCFLFSRCVFTEVPPELLLGSVLAMSFLELALSDIGAARGLLSQGSPLQTTLCHVNQMS